MALTHAFSRGRRDNKFRCARKSSCFAMQARQREDISKHRFRSLEPLDESFHNYPRYLIIINGIDETQAGAASTNPRLKRGKVTRWNARFRNETSSQEVIHALVCSIACFRLSNFLLQFRPGEIISRHCGWVSIFSGGREGIFSMNKFGSVRSSFY